MLYTEDKSIYRDFQIDFLPFDIWLNSASQIKFIRKGTAKGMQSR